MKIVSALLLTTLLASAASSQTPWTIGSRVHSVGNVCARPDTLGAGPAPCGTGGVLRAPGSLGTLVRGPAGSTTKWGVSWYVHYDIAPDGWSTAQYLALDSLTTPPPPPTGILSKQLIVWPSTSIPTVGSRVVLYTIYRDTTGAVSPGIHATWTSSNSFIATVDSFGGVTAKNPGIDTIIAIANGLSAKSILDVRAWQSITLQVLGVPIATGQYDYYPTDSTGKKTAHITIWVQTP